MNETGPEREIAEFVRSMGAQVPEEVFRDVIDWVDHREWLLALEVLAENLHESGVELDKYQWKELVRLAKISGGDEGRFRFICPS